MPFFPPFDFQRDVLALWGPAQAHDTAMTIVMGSLVAVACGWLGCWLILQGLALVGDAISHTVLLGMVVAFLVTGSTSGIGMFVGATVTGVVTVLCIDALHVSSRLKEDAAIGIVFTSLFALGVALLGALAGRAHIDTNHVLYGNLEFVTSGESVTLAGIDVPIPVCEMAGVLALILVLIIAFYKELLLVAFDSQLAASLGIRPVLFRYGLLAVLSLTAVASFRAVGAVLVVAMLIVPAATAYLLTNRLPAMFGISAVVGILSSIVGYHVSYWLTVSVASTMVCVACGLFALTFLFAPEQGILAAWGRRVRRQVRAAQENVIRRLWKLAGDAPEAAVPAADVAHGLDLPRWQFAWSVRALVKRGWIQVAAAGLSLTPRGSTQAQRLDRAHRLWETFLVDQVGLPSDHVHPAAEVVEHVLTEQLIERLDDVLGHPETDPHGSPIPRSPMSDSPAGAFTLSKLRVGDRGTLAGISTEVAPADHERLAGEIARLGLALGHPIVVEERDPAGERWLVRIGQKQRVAIPHVLADAILVRRDARSAQEPVSSRPET